jgi:DNA gyrase subunit A
MGRTARGVRGISLRGDDYVAGVCVVEEGKDLLCITENGFGKRSPFDDFRLMKNRGGYGVTCYNLTEKSGILTGVMAVNDDDDLMMITDSGTIIRTPVAGIPTRSRSAGGVIVMRLGEDQKLVNFTVTAHEEPEEDEVQEAGEETVVENENKTEAPAESKE